MLTKDWQKEAEQIARRWPEEPTSSIAQMVLEETFIANEQTPPREVDLAFHEIKHWLVTYMACNPDT